MIRSISRFELETKFKVYTGKFAATPKLNIDVFND